MNNASLDIQHPELEIQGFFDTVTEETFFDTIGDLEAFNK